MKKLFLRLLACALTVSLLSVAPPPASAAVFSDVPAKSWAAPAISRAVELGLFQGDRAHRFGMGRQMSRGAFAVVLCRFFDWEMVTDAPAVYSDVQDPALWYYDAISTAYAHGAVTLQADAFRPWDPITREELTVMLVRALGYGAIAGLAQDLPMPFTDVDTGSGYLSMAYELGLVSGTSSTTFSPDRTATREQAAVILVRLYDKLHASPPNLTGILAQGQSLQKGASAVAISGGRLLRHGAVFLPDEESAATLRQQIHAAGGQALLQVTALSSVLDGDNSGKAAALYNAVDEGGYDGLMLDLPKLPDNRRQALTALVGELRKVLGEKLLFVTVEAPAWQGRTFDAYDYAALSAQADRLIVRVADYEPESGEFPTAPVQPLEEVYYALAELRNTVDADKLSLLIPTTASVWKNGKQGAALSAQEAEALLAESHNTHAYYAKRYACAYATYQDAQGGDAVVWYLDSDSMRERRQLATLFGVGELCLSDLSSLTTETERALSEAEP